jgi:peptidoglycan/xylan/chitin deacetylase (PgdA/CDA1 family)
LDHLKLLGVKATFFIVGSRVAENAAILQRTVEEGKKIIIKLKIF